MIALGGASMDLVGFDALSLAPTQCNALNRNMVSLVFDRGVMDAKLYANSILSDFGALIGMPVTTKDGDCMCRASPCSGVNNFICT